MQFDINKIRRDFLILSRKVYGKDIIYLDNGATTQKPKSVLEEVSNFYTSENANIHRGVHYLSNQATKRYEDARHTVQHFINAEKPQEIIFTKGTTDSINLVAFSFGEKFVNEGDEILVAETEHHSNIVPWQMLCKRRNAKLIVIPVFDSGEINIEAYKSLLSRKTKMVAISQVSNAFGTIFPVDEMVKLAHEVGSYVLVDGAQGIQHVKTDVIKSDIDFYVFSGHKIYAETGIGVLYGKESLLEQMPPYQGGGDMIMSVSFEKTTYADLPLKFEAGTANFVGAVSIASAIKYIKQIGFEVIQNHEDELMLYATKKLSEIDDLTIYGTAAKKTASLSFLLNGIHFYDTGMVLDKMGIAVRTGTHCVEPGMKRFGIKGTVRAGFAMYNTKHEIDLLVEGLLKVKKMFS